jgi:hypothetical protein
MLRFYFRNKSRQAFGPAAFLFTNNRGPQMPSPAPLDFLPSQRSKPPDHIEVTCSILAVNSRYSLVN